VSWGKDAPDKIGRWDSAKQELTLGVMIPNADMKMNLQIASLVAFSEIERLQNYPASIVLAGYAVAVDGIITDLETAVA
jgi:hypothetical protein